MKHHLGAPSPVDAACTLTQDELSVRKEQWRQLLRTSAVVTRRRPTGIEVRFQASEDTAAVLDALVEAEGECCSFLAWAVARSATEVVLAIAGPAGTEPIFDAWESDFRDAR